MWGDIVPVIAVSTGIIVPLSVFYWLYHEGKGKREAVIEIAKHQDNGTCVSIKISAPRPIKTLCKRPWHHKRAQRHRLGSAVNRPKHLNEGGKYFADQHGGQSQPAQNK